VFRQIVAIICLESEPNQRFSDQLNLKQKLAKAKTFKIFEQ
jgi:hypothetical protein